MMIREAISMVTQNIDLSETEMIATMDELMDGKLTDAQIGAFLTGLRMKGETVGEISGGARVMREKATTIIAPAGTVDTCGTGGDMSHTFNISTTAGFVVAAAGAPVAKHGNRSVSSRSGSADVLEALGVKIDLMPKKVEECLAKTGFGFLFAPLFHPAMKFAIGPRREIGIRTIFNVLGPLTNPAGAKMQLIGVFSDRLTEPLANALGNLGASHAMVVHGEDGLDEITVTDKTRVSEWRAGSVTTWTLNPIDYGIPLARSEDLTGGDAQENADITISILGGEAGPKRNIVVLNAAAALYVSGRATSIQVGVRMAEAAIDSGAALRKLNEVRAVTNA
jgi:anthranilate phosphoribosyltransferase